MKKVMIGILILIPIIILLVVAMVSTIVSAQAHIAVENIELKYKNSHDRVEDFRRRHLYGRGVLQKVS